MKLLHVPLALVALALAACNTLPHLDTEVAAAPGATRLEGTHGRALSAKQSRAILARLEARGQQTSIFDRHLALEQDIAGSALTIGNKVVLLQDGPATYSAMLASIAAATDSINMESYIFDDDAIGTKFSEALIARQAAGVQVSLIYDSVGSSASPKAFFKHLSDSGVQVLEFNPINPLAGNKGYDINNRDHRKLLVVDGRTAFMGGVNISGVYSSGSSGRAARKGEPGGGSPWRDTHLQVEGPVVADFQRLFLATWAAQKGAPMARRAFYPAQASAGSAVVRAIGSSPEDPFSLIYATLISAIDSSETSVHITNAYFVPDPQLLTALLDAAGRGVDVQIVLPRNTDNWMVFNAGRSYYDRLLEGGVKIYERRGPLLHAKTALIDGVWSTVGSANLDRRSFLHNQEVNAVVLGPVFAAQMQAMFAADVAASDAMTLAAWEQRPLADRVREIAARAWAYWL
jgi:cardiolipin synthase A/B